MTKIKKKRTIRSAVRKKNKELIYIYIYIYKTEAFEVLTFFHVSTILK